MSKFDQQLREVERSLAKLTGNKTQAAQFRKGLEKKFQQAAVKKLLKDQQKPGYPQKKKTFYNGLEQAVPFIEGHLEKSLSPVLIG